MKFIKDATWEEVFDGWRRREAHDPSWIECATKIKGWPDWESWRRFTASQLGLEKRNWDLYEFDNPLNEIPAMLMGPYTGWQSRVQTKNQKTFWDLVNIPEQYEYWKQVPKIESLIQQFPQDTELIGLLREDTDQLVCIEGHHRSMAIAVSKKTGAPIEFSVPVKIAVAKLPADETRVLDETLARGSTKNFL